MEMETRGTKRVSKMLDRIDPDGEYRNDSSFQTEKEGTMSATDEKKNRILESARDLFFRFNFSKVTIDEIAGGLGISKKTIYKYFPSKEAILQSVVRRLMHHIEGQARKIVMDPEMEYLEKLRRMMKFMGRQTTYLSMPLTREIKRKFPDLWQEVTRFRRDKVQMYMTVLMEEGIRQGIFRDDFNRPLFVHLYINLAMIAIDPEFLTNHSLSASDVFEEIISIIFEGVLTEHGKTKATKIIHRSVRTNG